MIMVRSLAIQNLLLGHPRQERVLGKSSVFQDATDSGVPDVTHTAAVPGACAVGETLRDDFIIESLPFLSLSDAELAAYYVVLSDQLLTLSH